MPKPEELRPIPQNIYPTRESLNHAVEVSMSELPITDRNTLRSVLMVYHNTLLKELQSDSNNPSGRGLSSIEYGSSS